MARSVSRAALLGLALTTLIASSAAIYPGDHWKYSTKLTTANYKSFIKDEVDSGKTLFVRWIASVRNARATRCDAVHPQSTLYTHTHSLTHTLTIRALEFVVKAAASTDTYAASRVLHSHTRTEKCGGVI